MQWVLTFTQYDNSIDYNNLLLFAINRSQNYLCNVGAMVSGVHTATFTILHDAYRRLERNNSRFIKPVVIYHLYLTKKLVLILQKI